MHCFPSRKTWRTGCLVSLCERTCTTAKWYHCPSSSRGMRSQTTVCMSRLLRLGLTVMDTWGRWGGGGDGMEIRPLTMEAQALALCEHKRGSHALHVET
jgi:hypothetical protein